MGGGASVKLLHTLRPPRGLLWMAGGGAETRIPGMGGGKQQAPLTVDRSKLLLVRSGQDLFVERLGVLKLPLLQVAGSLLMTEQGG